MRSNAIVVRFDVPWQLSPPTSKRRGVDVADEVEVVTPKKKTKQGEAHGPIRNYHSMIRQKWDEVVEKWGREPLIKDVLNLVPHKSGQPYTFTQFCEEVVGGGLCGVGQVTGSCNFPGCKYDHTNTISKASARKVCKLLDDYLAGKGAPVKKEKP